MVDTAQRKLNINQALTFWLSQALLFSDYAFILKRKKRNKNNQANHNTSKPHVSCAEISSLSWWWKQTDSYQGNKLPSAYTCVVMSMLQS